LGACQNTVSRAQQNYITFCYVTALGVTYHSIKKSQSVFMTNILLVQYLHLILILAVGDLLISQKGELHFLYQYCNKKLLYLYRLESLKILSMNYQQIHSNIMKLDPKIRMVTICDSNGKIMFTDHRPGVTNLLSPEESKKSLEMAVNAWKTRSELANKIGKGKYVLAEYEKVKRITMPLRENHLLYITTEVDADHSKVLDGVARLESQLK
jgi:hypothetical protein